MKQCEIDGCDREHKARGWCQMHYDRWRKTGDTGSVEPVFKLTANKQEFLDYVAADYRAGRLGDDCIHAPGCSNGGYGVVTVDKKRYTAHNYVLRQAVGPPPPDKPHAAHNCTTKGCVSPHHLEWKSPKENADDRTRDGTENAGARHGNSKLDDDKAREILDLHSTGRYTYPALADMYGVTPGAIGGIVRRERWKHL
jgi:hypothetical protein